MNKADIYYGFQFINNYFPDSYYINTINDCIKEDLIKSPLEFDKPLFIYKYYYGEKIIYYIQKDYLNHIIENMKDSVHLLLPDLKERVEDLLYYFKIENTLMNDVTLEGLIEHCAERDDTHGELSNSFINYSE